MQPVWLVGASGLRRRWRRVVLLVLVVGAVGAVTFGAAAGARRTSSALTRFNAASRSADLQIETGEPTAAQLEAFRRVPEVAAVAVLPEFLIVPDGLSIVNVPAAVDATFGSVIDRARLITGREANPSAVDEITIGEGLASLLRLKVGSHLDAASATPAEVATALSGGDPGQPSGPKLRLRVVGIVRRPLDLGELGSSGGLFALTPAFNRAYADRIGVYVTTLRVRTRDGAADLPHVEAEARRIFGKSPQFNITTLAPETQGARNAINVLALALWIFAGVAAIAGVVAIGIVLSRETALANSDQATMAALGFTRSQRIATSGPQMLIIAVGGAVLAVLGAVGASPLFPINVARRAEPNPGIHVDVVVMGLGIIAIAAVVVAIVFLTALRSTRRSAWHDEPATSRHPETVAERAARLGMPPAVTNGLRMALQRGRGRSAVPVRSAFLGAVFGVLGVTAAFVFAANVGHLVATPQHYGWTWDFTTLDATANTPCGGDNFGVERLRGVEDVAELCYTQGLHVDGRTVPAMAFASLRGAVTPEIVAGRAPRGPREVALGSTTLRALGKHIGDTVRLSSAKATLDYQVVGRVVLPPIGFGQPLADGAVLTGAGNAPLFDLNNFYRYFVGRYAPGADRGATNRAIAANPRLAPATTPTVPAEVDHLRQIGWIPRTLAALLGGLALLAVGHALFTSVRRRRQELALLKTLGFTRGQMRATIAWQAATIAAVGIVIGIPTGLVVGDTIWRAVATALGISTITTVPALALLIMIPTALALVGLVAFFPARAAARARPAIALRSE